MKQEHLNGVSVKQILVGQRVLESGKWKLETSEGQHWLPSEVGKVTLKINGDEA
jgi:hypothetical protein